MGEPTERLQHPEGRPARIALLLYGSPDHDSRVLKSAAALRDAGAEVLIIGRSIIHTGAVEGHSLIGADLPVYRTQDLDLTRDRKSTRLNSSHVAISYAVFCLKKKKCR